jgi:hypothetical protein
VRREGEIESTHDILSLPARTSRKTVRQPATPLRRQTICRPCWRSDTTVSCPTPSWPDGCLSPRGRRRSRGGRCTFTGRQARVAGHERDGEIRGRCRRDPCKPRITSLRRPAEPESEVVLAHGSGEGESVARSARQGHARAETRGARAASRAYRRRSSTAGRGATRCFRSPSYAFREEEPCAVERGRAVRARFRFRRRVVPRRVAPPKWCSSRSSRPAAFRSSSRAYRPFQEPRFARQTLARFARTCASSCTRVRGYVSCGGGESRRE